jgi:hypothetical protein
MVHQQQIDTMTQRLEQERKTPVTIDPTRYMMLCKRSGLVSEIQTLTEFNKSVGTQSQQEAELKNQIKHQILKLNRQVISINRKLKIY